jgi:hypothetical protein
MGNLGKLVEKLQLGICHLLWLQLLEWRSIVVEGHSIVVEERSIVVEERSIVVEVLAIDCIVVEVLAIGCIVVLERGEPSYRKLGSLGILLDQLLIN